MPRTLYLHIGAHRTATTSSQTFLAANRDALAARGWLYPFGARRHDAQMTRLFAGETDTATLAAEIDAEADAAAGEIHSVILSDEDVSLHPDLAPLAGFRAHFDVRVVYALRRQDTWLESWFFQNIKWQWNPSLAHASFREFLRRREEFHWIDYDRHLGQLEALFGADNVLPLVFESGQMPEGPVAALCDRIGLPRDGLSEPPHVNTSRSPAMAEFMRHLPLDEAPPRLRNALIRACETVDRETLGNTGRQSERVMGPLQRLRVTRRYAAGNRAVARRYFGRDALFFDRPVYRRGVPLALPRDPEVLMQTLVAPLLSELMARKVLARRDDAERAARRARKKARRAEKEARQKAGAEAGAGG
ncbi:hypothetical protein OG2516_18855 [Oceanicola granulosus HTCC2516]|uniref:Uncharacterized protein n=1 Tax=Oceanicola granulosus (strain ATCC BAA-861 / DSM 15982 / KCTC 12143 / HTCC2516) TaxID=314256 RepID=Q2C9U7_OCEGH|nr:hypothetical protein [Oceanicola granulosus]EAR49451.1 hypothetical protein OG2516_18855 [Oceanicola granulosus HTCC2516]